MKEMGIKGMKFKMIFWLLLSFLWGIYLLAFFWVFYGEIWL
jgi:hypothetical protein